MFQSYFVVLMYLIFVCVDQKLEAGLKVLEDGLAKHEVMVSEERKHRTRALEELRSLLRSPQTAAIVQLHERQIARRTKATERLNTFYFVSNAYVLKWFYVFLFCTFPDHKCSSTGSVE